MFGIRKSSFPSLDALKKLQGNGEPDFAVVGTSFYRQNIEKVRRTHRVQIGNELSIPITLRHDPENSKSPKRQAIGVYSAGLLLGHIPEVACESFLDALKVSAGISKADARIWFGANNVCSIRLSVLWPPHLEGEAAPKLKEQSNVGDGSFSLKLDSSGYRIDWKFMQDTAGKVNGRRVLEIGETFESDDGTLYAGDFGRPADFACVFGYVGEVPKSRERELDRLLNSLGGTLRVKYRLTRTSRFTHSVHIDFA
jgi:hypothetical protein